MDTSTWVINPPLTINNNGAILNTTTILKNVVASAVEEEYGALFENSKLADPMRETLFELGHPQPATPICTDNSTAEGLANDTLKQKRSKAMDMRYHWIRDRVKQQHFKVHWQAGQLNKADYFTKHFPPAHHKKIRTSYLHKDMVTTIR